MNQTNIFQLVIQYKEHLHCLYKLSFLEIFIFHISIVCILHIAMAFAEMPLFVQVSSHNIEITMNGRRGLNSLVEGKQGSMISP